MNEASKVQPHHLERGAYLYIRQSSMRQVVENVESTKRQYALRGRATALGWRDSRSSSSTATRASPARRRPGAAVFNAW
jgi:DNA invertase Pin-like site-specific DNA recombinase